MTKERKLLEIAREMDISNITIEELSKFITKCKMQPAIKDESSKEICDVKISKLLIKLGMPVKLKGFWSWGQAIEYCYQNKIVRPAMTLMLYPLVAEKCGSTPERIERQMRNAVEMVWDRGDMDLVEKIFGYSVSPNRGKPTNSEFLSSIVNYLLMEDQC